MLYQPRIISLILSFLIAGATAAFISLHPRTPGESVVLAFLVAFASSFLLIFITIEYLIFRELLQINALFTKLKKKEFKISGDFTDLNLNPLKKLNLEISAFTMIKQKEIEELRKIEEYRKEFIADLSHELKTPVFAAQGFIHTLLDGADEDTEVNRKFLEKAAKSLDRLDELVQNLLVLSEIESGSAKMQKTDIDLAWMVKEVFEQLEDKARRKKIKLELQEKGSQFYAEADPVRMEQVFRNLIENALKYGKENGWVKVEMESKKEFIEVEVKDNGQGISPDHQTRIFDRFYRIEKSRSKEKGGSGLGLAIVKRILEAHQSEIKVNSEADKGSAFRFKLKKSKSGSDL
jgi:two-component system phosphate regulon sensor histidine kinase PhoR